MAEEFVKMMKDGEEIEVHPLVVAAHKALGWKQVVTSQETDDEREETSASLPTHLTPTLPLGEGSGEGSDKKLPKKKVASRP